MIGMEMGKDNQVYILRATTKNVLNVVMEQAYIQLRTRVDDYQSLIVDEVGIGHREAICDSVHHSGFGWMHRL